MGQDYTEGGGYDPLKAAQIRRRFHLMGSVIRGRRVIGLPLEGWRREFKDMVALTGDAEESEDASPGPEAVPSGYPHPAGRRLPRDVYASVEEAMNNEFERIPSLLPFPTELSA